MDIEATRAKYGIKPKTAAEVAAFTFRLTGGNPNPEATANSFRANAATMRDYATKAAASKSGEYRGYTEASALEIAANMDRQSVDVPRELRKMMGR